MAAAKTARIIARTICHSKAGHFVNGHAAISATHFMPITNDTAPADVAEAYVIQRSARVRTEGIAGKQLEACKRYEHYRRQKKS